MTILEYLDDAIVSFEDDPADSDFQLGYQAALIEVRTVLMDRLDRGIENGTVRPFSEEKS